MSLQGRNQKPTIQQLYFLFCNLSSEWYRIGQELKLEACDLEKIKADLKDKTCDRHLIEMFARYIADNPDCVWKTFVDVLKKINEEHLAQKVEQYVLELSRIEIYPHKPYKRFVPMKDYCHHDQELTKLYFEPDKLSHTPISKFTNRIVSCLMPERTKWYEIGISLGISKSRLDEIEVEYGSHDLRQAITKMVRALIGKCTWREVINTLEGMKLKIVAKDVEELAQKECEISGQTATIKSFCLKKFRQNNFLPESSNDKEKRQQASIDEEELQEHVEKIHTILHRDKTSHHDYFLRSGRNKDILDNPYDHIRDANLSHAQLKNLTKHVEKIGELSCRSSKTLADQAKELMKDLQRVEEVRSQLREEKTRLELRKTDLEETSKDVTEEMKKLTPSTPADADKLEKLRKKNEEALNELDKVHKELQVCIDQLLQANANYNSIYERLTQCRNKLNTCKRYLNYCSGYFKDVQKNVPDVVVSQVFESSISESLAEIDVTHSKLNEIQKVLNEADHPYAENLCTRRQIPSGVELQGMGWKKLQLEWKPPLFFKLVTLWTNLVRPRELSVCCCQRLKAPKCRAKWIVVKVVSIVSNTLPACEGVMKSL